ncbi:MAG: signal peptidase I [Pseudomonadota bacterium]
MRPDPQPQSGWVPSGWTKFWSEWRGFILFIVVMLLFRSAIADWNQVPTGSMIPSILEGDRIVVDKTAYDLRVPFTMTRIARWGHPQRSDVITFESPFDGKLLVKRVIGVPGDTVELDNNRLTVNGETASYQPVPMEQLPAPVAAAAAHITVAAESVQGRERTIMVHNKRHPAMKSSFEAVTVPAEHYLVMGDNRDNSQDYRRIGFVHRDLILGRAERIAFSLDYENYYIPRGERFLQALD